jgi:hypothetical protein
MNIINRRLQRCLIASSQPKLPSTEMSVIDSPRKFSCFRQAHLDLFSMIANLLFGFPVSNRSPIFLGRLISSFGCRRCI